MDSQLIPLLPDCLVLETHQWLAIDRAIFFSFGKHLLMGWLRAAPVAASGASSTVLRFRKGNGCAICNGCNSLARLCSPALKPCLCLAVYHCTGRALLGAPRRLGSRPDPCSRGALHLPQSLQDKLAELGRTGLLVVEGSMFNLRELWLAITRPD